MVSSEATSIEQTCAQRLRDGADLMEVAISEHQITQLTEYLSLFEKWNKTYNLSAVREVTQMVDRHLLDSLSVVPYIDAENIIDVGTGGGLPGIPLAIMFPEKEFTLLDSNGKKTRFLFQVKTQLRLNNVHIENTRVESYRPESLFDGVISRAFSSLKDMTENCHHLLNPDGVFYAMKGIYPQHELSDLEKHYKVSASYSLKVPREEGQRHLLVLTH